MRSTENDDSDIEEHIDEMDDALQAPAITDDHEVLQLQSPKPKRRRKAKTLHPAESEAKVHRGIAASGATGMADVNHCTFGSPGG